MEHVLSNDMHDQVAIVLSVYNGEKYVEDQIKSIINQTYTHWTLYVRNDGSKDNSLAIVKRYAKIDVRIKLLDEHGINIGYNKSQEFLLSKVDEKYIVFCDQDDVFLPEKTEKSLRKLKEIETEAMKPALVHTEAQVVDSNLNLIKNNFIGKHGTKSGLNGIIFANCVSGSSMMINQSLKTNRLRQSVIN